MAAFQSRDTLCAWLRSEPGSAHSLINFCGRGTHRIPCGFCAISRTPTTWMDMSSRRGRSGRCWQGYPTRLLKGRGQWPLAGLQTVPNLHRTESMLHDLSALFPAFSIYEEDRDPRNCTVGAPVDWTTGAVWITEVTPTACWDDSLTKSRFRDISRVDVGDRYERNLLEVAGPPPQISRG